MSSLQNDPLTVYFHTYIGLHSTREDVTDGETRSRILSVTVAFSPLPCSLAHLLRICGCVVVVTFLHLPVLSVVVVHHADVSRNEFVTALLMGFETTIRSGVAIMDYYLLELR